MTRLPTVITDHQIQSLQLSLTKVASDNKQKLYQAIVNTPFSDRLLTTTIDLGIVVLLLVNTTTNTVDRIALSDTEHARGAVSVSAQPFHDIRIPMDSETNVIVKAIKKKAYQLTLDWTYLFTPILSPEQARKNQIAASIECSMVWPIKVAQGGAIIFSFYQPASYISIEHKAFAKKYAAIVEQRLKLI